MCCLGVESMNLALFKKSLDDINVKIGTHCEANILYLL